MQKIYSMYEAMPVGHIDDNGEVYFNELAKKVHPSPLEGLYDDDYWDDDYWFDYDDDD